MSSNCLRLSLVDISYMYRVPYGYCNSSSNICRCSHTLLIKCTEKSLNFIDSPLDKTQSNTSFSVHLIAGLSMRHVREHVHIHQNLCQATKTCISSWKLFPSSKTNKKLPKNTWRCFQNNDSITPELMSDHKSHMPHVYTGHCNCTRASLNGCISPTLASEIVREKSCVFKSSVSICGCMYYNPKLFSVMHSWSWRSHPISEY